MKTSVLEKLMGPYVVGYTVEGMGLVAILAETPEQAAEVLKRTNHDATKLTNDEMEDLGLTTIEVEIDD